MSDVHDHIRAELADENAALRRQLAQQQHVLETQRQAMQHVRGAVRRVVHRSQLPSAIQAVGEAARRGGVDGRPCGALLVDGEDPPIVRVVLDDGEDHKRLDTLVAGRVVGQWRGGQIAVSADLAEDTDRTRLLLYGQARALLEVPFSHGILFFTHPEPGAFQQSDAAFVALLADVLSDGLLGLEYRRELDVSEARYKRLVETPDLVILLLDDQWSHIYVSPRIEDWTGQPPETFHRDPGAFWEIIHPDERENAEKALDDAAQGRPARDVECRLRLNPDDYLWVALSAFPLYEEGGDYGPEPMIQVVLQNITSRKQAESVLRRSRAELEVQVHQRTRDLSAAVDDLQREITEREKAQEENALLEKQLRQSQKLQAIGQLTAGIAHNFNNMLMVILGNVGVTRQQAPTPLKPHLQDAEAAALKAAQMVKELMTFSRRREDIECTPISVDDLLSDTLAICRKTIDPQIDLELQLADDGPMVLGDTGQLEQVLLNFCLNSRDALEGVDDRPPRIVMRAETRRFDRPQDLPHPDAAPGAYVRICVEDNGCGMSEETRERALEPFFTTKEVERGTGLGLATAYGIIQQHSGWIEVDSILGEGTCMSFYLPATHISGAPAQEGSGTALQLGGKETILVIDDEEDIRKLLSSILKRYNYEVLLGVDGRQGLDLFKRERHRVDLVLLDLLMPRMSGREVLSEMLDLDPGTKVVVSTGIAQEDLTSVGAREIIFKPYQEVEILQTLRRVLDERP